MLLTHLLALIVHDQATQVFFLAPLALILADLVTGVARSLVRGRFSITYLADFAHGMILPYASLLVSFLAVPLISGVPYVVAAGLAKVAMSAFCLSILGSVLDNLARLFGKSALLLSVDTFINLAVQKAFPFIQPQSSFAPFDASVSATVSGDIAVPVTSAAPVASDISAAPAAAPASDVTPTGN